MTDLTMKRAMLEKIDQVFDKANRLYGTTFTRHIGENEHVVNIKFTTKGRSAGQASYRTRFGQRTYGLKLSLEAAQIDPNDALNDTIPHEIAHLVCYAKPNLGRNHDRGWKRVCIELGGTGQRCHDMKLTPARKVTKHLYRTEKGGAIVEMGPKRHDNIMRKGVVYTTNGKNGTIAGDRITPAGYIGVKQDEPQVQQAARAANNVPASAPAKPKPAAPRTTTTGKSKADQVKEFMVTAANNGLDKQDIIAWMIDQLGMTKAGASTYYYKYR